jgi:hypothetical protein
MHRMAVEMRAEEQVRRKETAIRDRSHPSLTPTILDELGGAITWLGMMAYSQSK